MNKIQKLIDERSELLAKYLGKEVEIFTLLGLRDEAQKAADEMAHVILSRKAARESGCYFDDMGKNDAERIRCSADARQ